MYRLQIGPSGHGADFMTINSAPTPHDDRPATSGRARTVCTRNLEPDPLKLEPETLNKPSTLTLNPKSQKFKTLSSINPAAFARKPDILSPAFRNFRDLSC